MGVAPGPAGRAAHQGLPERGPQAGRVREATQGPGAAGRTLARQEALLSGEASRAAEVSGAVGSAEAFAERMQPGLDMATFERKR